MLAVGGGWFFPTQGGAVPDRGGGGRWHRERASSSERPRVAPRGTEARGAPEEDGRRVDDEAEDGCRDGAEHCAWDAERNRGEASADEGREHEAAQHAAQRAE